MHLPEPIVDRADGTDPEHEALLADSVGLALLVVLETLSPAERLAFVLHDMFAVPFDEIAPIVDRSPEAARQLASRARRRVRARTPSPTPTWTLSARSSTPSSRPRATGTSTRLVAVLDPDVVLRADIGRSRHRERSAGRRRSPARRTFYSRLGLVMQAGAHQRRRRELVTTRDGEPFSVGGFTVRDGRIVEMDFLADPERLRELDLTILDVNGSRSGPTSLRARRRSNPLTTQTAGSPS